MLFTAGFEKLVCILQSSLSAINAAKPCDPQSYDFYLEILTNCYCYKF